MSLVMLLVAGCWLLPSDDAAALVADDLRFAENLALHRFFGLATAVVDDARADAGRLEGDQVELEGEASLVQARIWRRMSENTADEAERLAAQTKAVELLEDWSRPGSSFAFLDRMLDALEDLAGLYTERGKTYAARAAAGDAGARGPAEADFDRAEKAWRNVEKEAEDRAEEYEQAEQADAALRMRTRALNTLYCRGLNSIEWAEVSPPANRDLRLDQAFQQLDDFTWDAPPDGLAYYQAHYEQARALHRLGQADDARDLLQSVLGNFGPAWDQLADLNPALQAGVVSVFDRVWGYLALLDQESGDLAAAEKWIDGMITRHADAKVPPGRDGLRVLLDWADRLAGLGRSSRASEIIQYVVEQGRGTPEGDLAGRRFAQVVKQGGAATELSPAVLIDAAKGFASESHWADAAHSYLRAAAGSTAEVDRRQFGYDAWMGAGSALRQAKRFLEAALCFEQALALVQELDFGVEPLETAATRMYEAYDARFAETQDAFDKQLRDDASDRLLAIPDIELDLAFFKATETFGGLQEGDAAGFGECQRLFESVPETSPNHERALVFVARCLLGAGQGEQALAAFEAVERRFADPAHEPKNAAARAKREIAVAQCRYYHATLLLSPAMGRAADALALLAGYEDTVPGQESFHDLARLRRIEAHALLGDVAAAEEALAELREAADSATYVVSAAFKVAAALEQVARAATEPAKVRDLLHRAADAMWVYCEASGFESFTNMVTTGEWYLEAGDPQRAQQVFQQTIETFNKKLPPEQLDRASIALASAFDAQGDFARARPLWIDLVDRNPTSFRIRTGAARSFGGWLELDDVGEVHEVAGSGDYEKAHTMWAELFKTASVNNKYQAVWWEAKLGAIDSLYRLGTTDSQKARNARLVLENLKIMTPEYDETTLETLPEEQRYTQLYKPFFRYLDRKLPAR